MPLPQPTDRPVREAAPTWRDEGQRDRDRILYSAELSRLAGVTQVTMSEPGLGLHNRLTHTLKVAQYARRLAERLQSSTAMPSFAKHTEVRGMSPDVVEAAALAHDLGHPPFGHVAEAELGELMSTHGGFEGNAQSFRIVTRLATGPQACDHQGLNLSRATLNGILKYPWLRSGGSDAHEKFGAYTEDKSAFSFARQGWPRGISADTDEKRRQRSLEAELMDWADDVTYAIHDLEDFHRVGLVPMALLANSRHELKFFSEHLMGDGDRASRLRKQGYTETQLTNALDELRNSVAARLAARYDGSLLARGAIRIVADELLGRFMGSLLPRTPDDKNAALVARIPHDDALVAVLKELTWCYVIDRAALGSLQIAQRQIIRDLFRRYTEAANTKDWRIFPAGIRDQVTAASTPASVARRVCDLIAGLTDAEAYEVHARLQGQLPGSVLSQLL